MAYKFNPFTDNLDYYESGSGGGVTSFNGLTGDVFNEGQNIGVGVPVFLQNSVVGQELFFEFRGLTSTDGSVTITDNTTDIDLSAAGGGITSGASDPVGSSNYTFFYNTTEHKLKMYLFDTWVSFIDFKDIMLTDETGDPVVDETGAPILETDTIDYIRS